MPLHLPTLLKKIPSDLEVCQPLAKAEEIAEFTLVRKRYAADPAKAVAEGDKIRAFRLMKGARRYLEIGTFDKFNLCYVMTQLLAPSAIIIDLDIAENLSAKERLQYDKPAEQEYKCIIGDSSSSETRDVVLANAGGEQFDAVFIDANHTAAFAMSDFALYGELIGPMGYVFFHDVKWEGGPESKGVADALDVLQRFVPVFQVLADGPVTHWHRPLVRRQNNWGGVAIIRGQDLHGQI